MDSFTPTPLSRIKRHPERAAYDRDAVYAILDAGLVCHVGYVLGDQPLVTPTIHWREGDTLYWHGSAASRMLETLAAGVKACVTVTIVDGLVLARSAFTHSMNYRSAMVLGTAKLVEGREAKLAALEYLIERLYPGRWATLRPPLDREIRATSVIAMPIAEASAKTGTGPPLDYDYDMGERAWAGVIPLTLVPGAPIADPRLDPEIALPEMLARYALPR